MKEALDFQISKCIHPSFSIAYLRVLVLPNGDPDISRADLLSLRIQSYLQLSCYNGGFVIECASLMLVWKQRNTTQSRVRSGSLSTYQQDLEEMECEFILLREGPATQSRRSDRVIASTFGSCPDFVKVKFREVGGEIIQI